MKPIRMLLRSIRDAFKSVFRHFTLSLASISCITITLIIVAIAILLSANINNFAKMIKEDVTIVVFTDKELEEKDINNIKTKFETMENISTYTYISKDDLKKEMAESSDDLKTVIDSWDDDENPLRDSFKVKVKKLENIEDTARVIRNIKGIYSVKYGETMVNDFLNTLKAVEKATVGVVIALTLVTVFLIINTIKITIYARAREISIMRLVGASNISIKMPFVIAGMVLGFIGSIVPILLVIYGYFGLYKQFGGKLYSPLFELLKPEPFIYLVSLVILAIGVVVGMIGSYRAVRKYLKV